MTTTLVLESCPLHTEEPRFAVHAPAQLTAACKRGAHVIALTEVHKDTLAKLTAVAEAHGYHLFHQQGDTALVYKRSLNSVHPSSHLMGGTRFYSQLEFALDGNAVTVFGCHWDTNTAAHKDERATQTRTLIKAMETASAGRHVAFYLADSNPSASLRVGGSPQKQLRAAGLPLIYDEVGWPKTPVGVTTIGRNKKDLRVKGLHAVVHARLGSDHNPVTATYRIGA